MSDYCRQNLSSSNFKADSSWVILSEIEKRIKEKIEKVGKPLKDWDIKIYRGILTGYNEAFIIDGKIKDALIAKSAKNAEIIRPILRGRDIKRYKADFADLWIINTHNGTITAPPINIDDYPHIKEHLDKFYPALEKRQDKGVTPYHLRSCIYTDDFSKQKIVWKRVGSRLKFCIDEIGYLALDSTCFASGKKLKYLVAILNSKIGNYLLKDSPQTGTGDLLISVQALEPIKIPLPEDGIEQEINRMVDEYLLGGSNSDIVEESINQYIYKIFNLSDDEIEYINMFI